jgi:Cd2+/Zn2+-exporting ATPase
MIPDVVLLPMSQKITLMTTIITTIQNGSYSIFKMFLPSIISLLLLLIAIVFDNYFSQTWFVGWVRIVWFCVAYISVGLPVLKEAYESIRKGAVFSEFFLMGIATIGAFVIGQYAEGVAVMLFYSIGELFQMLAVKGPNQT